MGDFLENVIPLIIMFMIFRGILKTILGNHKHNKSDLPEDNDSDVNETGNNSWKEKPNLAAEFERKLRKNSSDSDDLITIKESCNNKQIIHREDEHNENLLVDKSNTANIYQEYLKNNWRKDDGNTSSIALDDFEKYAMIKKGKTSLKLRKKLLAKGIILSQILDKPRSLNPYGSENNL